MKPTNVEDKDDKLRVAKTARRILFAVFSLLSNIVVAQDGTDANLCMGTDSQGRRLKPEGYKPELAIAACTRELAKVEPTDERRLNFYLKRGYWRQFTKDYDGAIGDFTEAIRLRPNTAILYYVRAAGWGLKKDYVRAIADMDEDIRLSPRDFKGYIARGNFWRRNGNLTRAKADFNEALHINPEYWLGYNDLAWLLATTPDGNFRDGKAAVEYATKACEASMWRIATAIGTLAAAYAEAGNFDKAVSFEEKALADADYRKLFGEKAPTRIGLYKQHKAYRD